MIPITWTRFTGRAEWKTQAEKEKKSLDAILDLFPGVKRQQILAVLECAEKSLAVT